MRDFCRKHEYLLAAVFFLLTQAPIFTQLIDRYPDTDNYTHAIRLLDLIQSKTWAETPYMHSNYPFGEVLHFTRITDIFWGLSAAPLMLFLPLKSAVFWGGYVFQAIVGMLTAAAVVWALKPVVSPFFRLFGAAFFLLMPSSTETFILSKPDHHALTALFAVLTIGGMIRALAGEAKAARQAGLFAALGLWTSVEGIAIAYAVLLPVVLSWIFNRESLRPAVDFTMSFFACSLLFLAINPPYEGFFAPDNGRLSFLFAVIIGLSAASFAVCARIQSADWEIRFAVLAGAVAVSAAVVLGLFGTESVFAPWFPPLIKAVWANSIIELKSAFSSRTVFLLVETASLAGLACGAASFKKADSFERKVLFLTVLPMLIFAGMTAAALRYSRLSSIFAVFPIAAAGNIYARRSGSAKRLNSAGAIALLYGVCAVFLGFNYQSVFRVLNAGMTASPALLKPFLPVGKGAVLAEANYGPEVLWMTQKPVVGTPYHRNVEGIADGFFMLHDQNAANVLYLLKKHQVRTIALYAAKFGQPNVLSFDWRGRRRYGLYSDAKNEFSARLVRGTDLPCGIKPVEPSPLPWLVYHVDFSDCALAGSSS